MQIKYFVNGEWVEVRQNKLAEAFDHAAAHGSEFAKDLYKITTNNQGHIISASPVTKSDLTEYGLLDSDSVASNYNENDSYTAGEFVIYDGKLYKALENCGPESFNPSKWEAANILIAAGSGGTVVSGEADWNAQEGEPGYIKNKPTSPSGGAVDSVNGKTGIVVLNAEDVGALSNDISIPTKTSDLIDDSNFISDANYVHTDNNYTNADKTKLAGIEAGATVDDKTWNGVTLSTSATYTSADQYIPVKSTNQLNGTAFQNILTETPTAYGVAKYDNNAHLKSTTPANNDNSTKVATTAFVNNAISSLGSILNYKGTKPTVGDLPQSGNTAGDIWIIESDGSQYIWNGTSWDNFSSTVDLSGYVQTSRTINGKALSENISLNASDVGALSDAVVVPSKTSDLTNDSGFITINDIPDGAFVATYGVTTFAEVNAAYFSGEALFVRSGAVPSATEKYAPLRTVTRAGSDISHYSFGYTDNSGGIKYTWYTLDRDSQWSTTSSGYFVEQTRQINGKSLSSNITLNASDVGALSSSTDLSVYMTKGVDYVTAGQRSNMTLGTKATAEGDFTAAMGDYSHAEGVNTVTVAMYAHAEGYQTTVNGRAGHAEGTSTSADGQSSHAEGGGTTASGENSHAEGTGTTARRKAQHTFGEYNILDASGTGSTRGTYVEIVGNGTGVNSRSNARTLDWSGNEVLSGKLTLGVAPTENMDAATKLYVDSAVPTNTSDLNNDSGFITSTSLSNYMVKGTDYITSGLKANTTLGTRATAEGFYNTASGNYSHAEGNGTTASGNDSHAEGQYTTASGTISHAEGQSTTASGMVSHAEGHLTTASGNMSHAEGYYTVANHASQHVFGEYNIADASVATADARGNYVEIVGNGTLAVPSNARTLDWDGNEVLTGKLTVGAAPVNDMDVATKVYVDTLIPLVINVKNNINTKVSDINAAIADGRAILAVNNGMTYTLHHGSSEVGEHWEFCCGQETYAPLVQENENDGLLYLVEVEEIS